MSVLQPFLFFLFLLLASPLGLAGRNDTKSEVLWNNGDVASGTPWYVWHTFAATYFASICTILQFFWPLVTKRAIVQRWLNSQVWPFVKARIVRVSYEVNI